MKSITMDVETFSEKKVIPENHLSCGPTETHINYSCVILGFPTTGKK